MLPGEIRGERPGCCKRHDPADRLSRRGAGDDQRQGSRSRPSAGGRIGRRHARRRLSGRGLPGRGRARSHPRTAPGACRPARQGHQCPGDRDTGRQPEPDRPQAAVVAVLERPARPRGELAARIPGEVRTAGRGVGGIGPAPAGRSPGMGAGHSPPRGIDRVSAVRQSVRAGHRADRRGAERNLCGPGGRRNGQGPGRA